MAITEEMSTVSSAGIDEAIGKVENLYRAVTGANPPQSDVPYSPIPVEKDPSKYVEQQVDRLLEMLGPGQTELAGVAWTPPIAIWDNEKEFLLCLDLPGVSRKDVEVTVNDNLLTVAGHRPSPTFDGHRLRATERPIGPFARQVLLPPSLRRAEAGAQVSAQMREGVLEIRVNKEGTRAEKPRPIPVN
jgi:HSP20 family protein